MKNLNKAFIVCQYLIQIDFFSIEERKKIKIKKT